MIAVATAVDAVALALAASVLWYIIINTKHQCEHNIEQLATYILQLINVNDD